MIKTYTRSTSVARTGTARTRPFRRFVGAAATAMFIVGAGLLSGVGAAPAQAAPGEAFEIFYGQNCSGGGTASRVYAWESHQSKESWINDKFDSTRFGSAGLGQSIRNNAASVYIKGGVVMYFADGTSFVTIPPRFDEPEGACYNFNPSQRNHNVAFAI